MGMDLTKRDPFGGPGTVISADDVKSLHDAQGYNVKWEKATYCPCRVDDRFEKHDMNCDVCENRMGLVYFDPIIVDSAGDPLRALVTGLSKEQQYKVEGYLDMGSAYISIPAPYEPSYFDRITLVDSRIRVQELIKRGDDVGATALTDKLRYPALTTAEDGGIVYVIDGTGTVRTANVSVDSAGDALWDSAVLTPGDIYSLVYYRRPSYIVMDIPHAVRDTLETTPSSTSTPTLARLGTQVIAKLDFLIRDQVKVI